jgi:N-acetylglucosamine kinase-like BadF-type ATPase
VTHGAGDRYLGIDGGGSTSRARLDDGGTEPLLERTAGPANAQTVSPTELRASLDALLRDCPSPTAAAICLAGCGPASEARPRVERYFRERFPTTTLRFEPDYVAALACFDEPIAACVLSGTGSVVCSVGPAGDIVTSGGQGFLVGDDGSAFRLGQRLLERFGRVHEAANPPAVVARAAPVLTAAASRGCAWAQEILTDEMRLLAGTVARHLARHQPGAANPAIGVIGGTWNSEIARCAFADELRREMSFGALVRAARQPVEAAVLLARQACP